MRTAHAPLHLHTRQPLASRLLAARLLVCSLVCLLARLLAHSPFLTCRPPASPPETHDCPAVMGLRSAPLPARPCEESAARFEGAGYTASVSSQAFRSCFWQLCELVVCVTPRWGGPFCGPHPAASPLTVVAPSLCHCCDAVAHRYALAHRGRLTIRLSRNRVRSRPPLKRSKVMYQEEIPFGAAGAIFLRSQAKESRKTERIYTVFPDARLLYSCQTESLKS
jgi:hypothetical protein